MQRRVVPETLQVGEVGRVEMRLTNLRRGTTPPLHLWEPVSGMGGATLRLAPLVGSERVAANYRLPATRRGTVTFGPSTVERRDPFGLCSQRRTLSGTHEVVVLPAHVNVALPSGNGGTGAIGQHLRIAIETLHLLKEEGDGLHSRKLRSFDEPPLR